MTIRTAAPVAALLFASAACGEAKSAGADSVSLGRPATGTAGGGAARGKPDDCPRTGHWSACQVKRRLEQAGVAPRLAPSPAQELPRVAAPPIVYLVGTSELAVYLFADTATRRSAARALDTLHFVAPSHGLTTRGEATAIENDNLLALLFSRKDQQRERVSDALSAGPPQP